MQVETGMMSCLVSLGDIFLSLQNLSEKYLSLESWCRELSPGTHIVGGLQSLSRKAVGHSLSRKAKCSLMDKKQMEILSLAFWCQKADHMCGKARTLI